MQKFIQKLATDNLGDEQIEKIVAVCNSISVKKNEILIKHNTLCDNGYFIIKGGFICRFRDDEKDIQKTVNFYLEDFQSTFTCVDSYLSGNLTSCEIVAICDSEIVQMRKCDMDRLANQDSEIYRFLHFIISTVLIEENEMKMKIISETSEGLYNFLINKCTSVIRMVPSKFIAEFMGITPEWLSKLRKRK
jgi:CRP-like cAMP-binding protein